LVQLVAGSLRRCWLDSLMQTRRRFVRQAQNGGPKKHLVSYGPLNVNETEEEQIAILTSDDPSPSRSGSSVWTDTRIVQTSDGPENEIFHASSTNRSSVHQLDKGGHFAAWEQPKLFSEEVRASFRSLR